MRHRNKTPPFRGPDGEPLPGSIAEIEYLRLGGLDQWVNEARRRKHRRALKELRAIGRPPYDARAKMVQGRWLGLLLGAMRGTPLWKVFRIALSGPEASILDLSGIMRGMRFSQHTMWEEVSRLNLVTAVPELQTSEQPQPVVAIPHVRA